MNRKICLVALVLILVSPLFLFARVTGIPKEAFDGPFLLTSGGQGPGSKMLRLLLNKDNAFSYGKEFFLEDEPEPRLEELEKGIYRTLVVVIGSTEKGLNASGEDIAAELENLRVLLSEAKSLGMKVVAMSIESDKRGKGIMGAENEYVIDLVCPYADWILCLKANDKDKRFTKFSREYGVPLTIVTSALEISGFLPGCFVQ